MLQAASCHHRKYPCVVQESNGGISDRDTVQVEHNGARGKVVKLQPVYILWCGNNGYPLLMQEFQRKFID